MTKYKRTAAIVASLAAIAAVVYLALNDPAVSVAPRCLFHTLTGLDCPGCGTQRAIHSLLNGNPAEAWHYNAALFFAIPIIGMYAVSPRRMERFLYAPATLYCLAGATALWWVLRNIC